MLDVACLFILCTFQKLSDKHRRIAHDSPTFQCGLTFIESLGLFTVFPVYSGDLPAEDTLMVFCDFLPESFQNFMGIEPHLWVLFLVLRGTAKPEPHNCQRTDDSATDFPVSAQSSTEGPHCFDNFVIFLSQLLLPDRKNGLTSMKALHHHLYGLILFDRPR